MGWQKPVPAGIRQATPSKPAVPLVMTKWQVVAIVGEPVPDLEEDPLAVAGDEAARRVARRPLPQDILAVADRGEQHAARA